MPPKPKQKQAGKFKPLKRPARRAAAVAVPTPSDAPPSAADGGGQVAPSSDGTRDGSAGRQVDGSGSVRGASPTRGGRGRSHSPKGRGGGRGGGRSGRGGRGRGRGRFVVPAGAAFFTGGMARRGEAAAIDATAEGGGANMETGAGGAANVPEAKAASSARGRASRSAAATAAAAARASEGEGEEIVVAEMMDVDEGEVREVKNAKASVKKEKPARRKKKEDLQEAEALHQRTPNAGVDEAYVYDSDSSMEDDLGGASGGFPMPPTQLPFPISRGRPTMYECQDGPDEEKKLSEEEARATSTTTAASASRAGDPPLKSPFLDPNAASDEEKKGEADSWYLMKFPTRLPRLDASSTASTAASSSKRTAVKSEFGEEGLEGGGGAHMDAGEGGASAAGRPAGCDDALKDAVPGRYGRIVVRRSGRTELILGGGGDGEPEVRLLVHEGLRCGFRQEAASIDPEGGTFVSLGDVDKSLVVTPDVDRAFAHA